MVFKLVHMRPCWYRRTCSRFPSIEIDVILPSSETPVSLCPRCSRMIAEEAEIVRKGALEFRAGERG
jgi:hypothetical protein